MHRMRKLTSHIMASSSPKVALQNRTLLTANKQMLSTQNTSATAATEEKQEQSVLIEEISGNYLVTLNRPKALNALNIEMIHTLTSFYETLITQQRQCTVVMRGVGDKAFCAGGDVRKLYDLGMKGAEIEEITEFFKLEYILDHLLGTLPDYVHNVCILNGITMGGGVGISVHGRYRIATNHTTFAMPETGIGFYTDVGGSYFLPRLVPNGLGLYLALNGYRLKGCDVLHAGIATHYVEKERIESLISDLLSNTNVYKPGVSAASVLSKYATHASQLPEFTLKNEMDSIRNIFSFDQQSCVEDIMKSLQSVDNDWGSNTLKQLMSVSPTSLKVVHRALDEGRNKTLRECLDMEFGIVSEFMRQHDFYEGIRAALVDKDRNPKWKPTNLSDVGSIESYFPKL